MGAIVWEYWSHTNHCIILFESLSRLWSGNFPVTAENSDLAQIIIVIIFTRVDYTIKLLQQTTAL